MKIIKIDQHKPDPAVVAETAELLKSGAVIAFPTDTFYGLGADISNEGAVRRIYSIKGRGYNKPILILISDRKELVSLISNKDLPTTACSLMDSFWPGPLTIVFYATESLSVLLTASTGKIGIRLPDHEFCRKLIEKLEGPVTATSANVSGEPSLNNPNDVLNAMGDRIDVLVDGGITKGGLESTVVDVTGDKPVILREGAISSVDIRTVINQRLKIKM